MKVLQGIHGFPPINRTKSSQILSVMDKDGSHVILCLFKIHQCFELKWFTISYSVTTVKEFLLINRCKEFYLLGAETSRYAKIIHVKQLSATDAFNTNSIRYFYLYFFPKQCLKTVTEWFLPKPRIYLRNFMKLVLAILFWKKTKWLKLEQKKFWKTIF